MKHVKKMLAWMLVLCMLLGTSSVNVLAAEVNPEAGISVVEEDSEVSEAAETQTDENEDISSNAEKASEPEATEAEVPEITGDQIDDNEENPAMTDEKVAEETPENDTIEENDEINDEEKATGVVEATDEETSENTPATVDDTELVQADGLDVSTQEEKGIPEIEALREARDISADGFYKIVHLDCGRKYFTVDWVKNLITEMKKAGYTHLELAFGNDGLRFLLNDMTVTIGETTYSSEAVTAGIQSGNKAYYNAGDKNEWSQKEMDEILAAAGSAGISIIPLLNTPGHMDAIIDAMETVGISDAAFTAGGYGTSSRTVSLTNTEAVAFTQALVEKYVAYFANKGCEIFNLGTDEYANDILINYSGMGFGYLQQQNQYSNFVKYVNSLSTMVTNAGMTPMAFNDGIYYKKDTTYSFNEDILIAYWSNGWGNYVPASAEFLAGKGYRLVNTHGDFYYVLGKSDNFDSGSGYAEKWDNAVFQGTTFDSEQAGAMFCIWCDYPGAETEKQITEKVITAGVLSALSEKMGHGQTAENTTVTCENGIVSVTAPGLTSLSCKAVEAPNIEEAADGKIIAYDVIPYVESGKYTESGDVSITIPTGWDSTKVKAFVVNGESDITKGIGTVISDGKASFTSPHFSVMGLYEAASTSVEVTEPKTVTVTKGQTITVNSVNDFLDVTDTNSAIATVGQPTETQNGYVKSTEIVSGKQYILVNQENVLTNKSTQRNSTSGVYGLSCLTEFSESGDYSAYLWTINKVSGGYTIQDANGEYLNIATGSVNQETAVTLSTTAQTLSIDAVGDAFTIKNGSVYLDLYGDGFAAGWGANYSNNNEVWTLYECQIVYEVTITGHSVGTTTAIIGDTVYTIKVVEEDLSAVTPLTVEYWITNRQVTANGATSGPISAGGFNVNSEEGALFSNLVPATGSHDSNVMLFWKGTRLDSGNKQTDTQGVDRTTSGTDFTYIRYWNGSWAYSADRETWTNVASGDQIVAYYLQKTDVTDEVTTEVVDWGVVPSTSYNSSDFVLVDFAVKYESGERTPDSFPVDGKTMAFHCVIDGSGSAVEYGRTKYRKIGMIKAEESENYEVYMITVTPTNDSSSGSVAGNANAAKSYRYDGTEKVVWVDDEKNLGAFADESLHYTSISGDITYSSGGEAIVPGLEIFNQQGMLVTYYVRAKVTADSLTVHYIDQTVDKEFYNYNIAVDSGTVFHSNIALKNPWKGDLEHGEVQNDQNKTQTVSADLSTMPAIGAQYRYSDYTCVRVVRSEDGKEVYLYYTFNNTHSFVIDFGLPLTITTKDLEITGNWSSVSVTGAEYGNAVAETGKGITYTPDKTLKGVESLQLTLSGDNGSSTQQIYIYPATTVYYEEGFASYDNSWTGGSKGDFLQTTEKSGLKINNYGYDGAYSVQANESNNTEASTSAAGSRATFEFTGTGVETYVNASSSPATTTIQVRDSEGRMVKLASVYVATTGVYGDQVAKGAYNTPIVSVNGLAHGNYTEKVYVVEGTIRLDGFRVYGTLADEATNEVYEADREENPSYFEMRNAVLTALDVNAGKDPAEVYAQVYEKTDGKIDGAVVLSSASSGDTNKADVLLAEGPKNELYLAKDQALVFKLNTNRVVQLGLKVPAGATSYKIIGKDGEQSISSITDMFYVISSGVSGEQTITITNTGENVLSVTKLKVCDEPSGVFAELTENDFTDALVSLGIEAEPDTEEPDEPAYADAVLNVAVTDADGKELAAATLTANGAEGESAVFAAADIQAAVEALELPEDYKLEDVSYSDVTVAYGETGSVSFKAVKEEVIEPTPTPDPEPEPAPVPDETTSIIGKIFKTVKNIFDKIFRW